MTNPPYNHSDIHVMDQEERKRLRAAVVRAKSVYPHPVAVVLAQELLAWAEFGYRFGGKSSIMRLTDYILSQSPPQPT